MLFIRTIFVLVAIFLFAGLLFFALPEEGNAGMPITSCCVNQTGCVVVGEQPVLCFEDSFVPGGMCTQVGEGGQCVESQVTRDVPTLSEWGLIAMAGVLGVVGFMVMRRKRATA